MVTLNILFAELLVELIEYWLYFLHIYSIQFNIS